MINDLIDKYGETATLGENEVRVYLKEKQKSLPTVKSSVFDNAKWFDMHIKGNINENDVFEINGQQYRVFDYQSFKENELYSHSVVTVYKDFFTEEVDVYKDKIKSGLPSLPEKNEEKIEVLNCKIDTIGTGHFPEYPLIKETGATHRFFAIVKDETYSVKLHNSLFWNNRAFNIVHIEDINEKKKFLRMLCTEVIVEGITVTKAYKTDFKKLEDIRNL